MGQTLLKKHVTSMVLATLITAIISVAWWYYQQSQTELVGLIQANGRVEGDSVIIAGKQAGRIAAILAREGDVVEANQVLVRLEDQTTRARTNQSHAALGAAQARADQCQAALELLIKEVPYQIAAAEAGVEAARATLDQAKAAQQQATRDLERYKSLFATGALDQEAVEQTQLKLRQADDAVMAAQASMEQSRQALNDAQLGPYRIRAKEAEVATFKALWEQTQAQLAEADSILDEMIVTAPSAGTLTARYADLGEVVTSGSPLFELVDLDRLYLEVFIPEKEIGKVRLGLSARIHTDAFPDQPLPAQVRYIASRAEFTPKEIQTPDERVKLVYAVKLYLEENPDHRLTPGLPADAMIRWQENVAWAKPRW